MDIYLSINNREEVIRLPVIPVEFSVSSPHNNETFSTITQGDIKLIGLRGLMSVAFESFFPARNYPFVRDRSYSAWEYVEKIEQWRIRRMPVRLVITDTSINMPVTIDSFEYGLKDKTGDVYYSIGLSEFKFVEVVQS